MSDVTFWLTPTLYGAMQKVRHSPRGVGQKGDQVWQGGGGSVKKSDVTHPKNFISNFSSYLFLWCLSDTCFTQFLFIPPVFDENNVNYWTKLSHGNDYLLSIFEVSVCHFLVSDMGGEGVEAKYDKVWQGGGGRKIAILGVTYFLNCPIHIVIVLKEFVLKQKMKNLLKSIFVSVDVHFFGDHVTMQNR